MEAFFLIVEFRVMDAIFFPLVPDLHSVIQSRQEPRVHASRNNTNRLALLAFLIFVNPDRRGYITTRIRATE